MAFKDSEVEDLLVKTGRRCCIGKELHDVSVHHIIHVKDGGTDHIDNGIPLCPNCHNEVHKKYAPGVTTKQYTPSELKKHREYTIKMVSEGILTNDHETKQEIDAAILTFRNMHKPSLSCYFLPHYEANINYQLKSVGKSNRPGLRFSISNVGNEYCRIKDCKVEGRTVNANGEYSNVQRAHFTGHLIEARLNPSDTAYFDASEFAELLKGFALGSRQLLQLEFENALGFRILYSASIFIESAGVYRILDNTVSEEPII